MHFITLIFTTLIAVSAIANDAHDSDGLTPLHRAAGLGDSLAVARLLARGADIFSLDSKMGVSVLHKAVYSGDRQTVELLLANGALVNLQSPSNGDTALHDAIYFRRGQDLSLIKTILAYKPSLAIKNRAGLTPIDSAKLLKANDIVDLLQNFEDARQSAQSRQLMIAVQANDFTAVTRLLGQFSSSVLGETDQQGFTPLLWAAREGFVEIVDLLLRHGADPNQNDQWMGANSGHKAAFWGHADVMKLLVAKHLNLNARGGYNGYTPLHDAVSRDHLDVAQILVGAGADLTITGHDGKTALDIARVNGNESIIQLLTHGSRFDNR